jgi:hypothetical protein
VLHHGIQSGQELAHAGRQRDLRRFSCGAQGDYRFAAATDHNGGDRVAAGLAVLDCDLRDCLGNGIAEVLPLEQLRGHGGAPGEGERDEGNSGKTICARVHEGSSPMGLVIIST